MDKFVVLSMTKESKEIARVLSNETAIKILNKLSEKRMSASEIAKELNLPMSTVQYNLDLLKGVNLIKDTAYRYSEKGKKILYYEPAKKLIILAPEKEKESILSVLKNNFVIPIALGLSIFAGFLGQTLFTKPIKKAVTMTGAEAPTASATAVYETTKIAFYQQPWFIFFLGAVFTTLIFITAYLVRKR
ncbi:MAG: winged helix-turn-helix transcriptional regulator [Nanoarchaeota archaeon]|nr:winged helix-turn-helix transcriptional regulator [Nanoarchaeota archaeon]